VATPTPPTTTPTARSMSASTRSTTSTGPRARAARRRATPTPTLSALTSFVRAAPRAPRAPAAPRAPGTYSWSLFVWLTLLVGVFLHRAMGRQHLEVLVDVRRVRLLQLQVSSRCCSRARSRSRAAWCAPPLSLAVALAPPLSTSPRPPFSFLLFDASTHAVKLQ